MSKATRTGGVQVAPEVIARFWRKVTILGPTECWLFTGREIRRRHTGEYGIGRSLAREFGVSCAVVSEIKNRKHWTSV